MGIVFFVTLYGCDLPRDNPLDPKSYNYGLQKPEETDLPQLYLTSFHSSQWYPSEDIFSLEGYLSGINTGFADSVHIVWEDTLFYPMSLSGNEWRLSLESSNLITGNLFDLIGVSFHGLLFYNGEDTICTDNAFLYRIIEEIPLTDEPSGNDIVSPTPVFSWFPAELKHFFSHNLTINHISTSGFVTEVACISGISSDSSSYNYQDSLSQGNYYWTISLVDVYENISRSKEAAFTVVP